MFLVVVKFIKIYHLLRTKRFYQESIYPVHLDSRSETVNLDVLSLNADWLLNTCGETILCTYVQNKGRH